MTARGSEVLTGFPRKRCAAIEFRNGSSLFSTAETKCASPFVNPFAEVVPRLLRGGGEEVLAETRDEQERTHRVERGGLPALNARA